MITFEDALPFITLLVGGLIGNRLAIGRDRRKDFNDVANPLFECLEKQRICAKSGEFPDSAHDTNQETFIALIRKSPWHKQKGLAKAIEGYLQAKQSCSNWNNRRYEFSKPEVLISAIEKLQGYVPHK